jgi:hypothetical protein
MKKVQKYMYTRTVLAFTLYYLQIVSSWVHELWHDTTLCVYVENRKICPESEQNFILLYRLCSIFCSDECLAKYNSDVCRKTCKPSLKSSSLLTYFKKNWDIRKKSVKLFMFMQWKYLFYNSLQLLVSNSPEAGVKWSYNVKLRNTTKRQSG